MCEIIDISITRRPQYCQADVCEELQSLTTPLRFPTRRRPFFVLHKATSEIDSTTQSYLCWSAISRVPNDQVLRIHLMVLCSRVEGFCFRKENYHFLLDPRTSNMIRHTSTSPILILLFIHAFSLFGHRHFNILMRSY